jgi:long-chain acyl-CoA synthetase
VFHWAVGVGARWTARTLDAGRDAAKVPSLDWRLADRLVFSKIRERLGGRLRCLISGSAALSPEIGRFFYGAGLPIMEGYGLTETAPILTVNPLDRLHYGTVGVPLRGVELRLDEDGEILVRGPNVMQGYYNRPEATAAVLRDGWFRTGDVGRLDADGFLSITDRKKDLLVTSGGKKIAPQPIENLLRLDPLVAEAVLISERRRFPAVLLVPEFGALERRMTETGAGWGTREEMVRRPDAIALYRTLVDAVNERLARFERIRKFVLLPEEFSIERGELTPTMKVRRKAVEQRWCDLIESMYAEADEA